jgi:hypothetical protein
MRTGSRRPKPDNRGVTFFFDVAYAVVIFVALALAGSVPGCLLGLLVPSRDRRQLLPAVALGLLGWVWFGWIGGDYGISRLGLVVFSAVGAAGFVRGWLLGREIGLLARAAARARARCSRRAATPR